MTPFLYPNDSNLDLRFKRLVDLPQQTLWDAWTKPEHLVHWFTPAPWKTLECQIDLRPGGEFYTLMQSPEGEQFPSRGCFLWVQEPELLVWTDCLGPGFRPTEQPFVTAVITLSERGESTLYQARVMHRNEEDRKQHEEMRFEEGWGKALDQLVAHMKHF